MVDTLLASGANTCGVDENGNSALHLACFYGNRDVVQLLLSVDVDVGVSFCCCGFHLGVCLLRMEAGVLVVIGLFRAWFWLIG